MPPSAHPTPHTAFCNVHPQCLIRITSPTVSAYVHPQSQPSQLTCMPPPKKKKTVGTRQIQLRELSRITEEGDGPSAMVPDSLGVSV
eukprot:1342031-Rhodomonas_salina.4